MLLFYKQSFNPLPLKIKIKIVKFFFKMISQMCPYKYVTVYKLDRFSRDKYATAIYKKTLKDNGVKVLSCMENIPDTPEGIILESLLEGYNKQNGLNN